VIKVNTDGSFFAASNMGGWGYVIRDCNGVVLGAAAGRIDNASDALHTKAVVVFKAIQAVVDQDVSDIWVESDAQCV
jgi:ribonuclease HI